MKICVRAECSPESLASRNGELAEIASSSGQDRPEPVAYLHRAVGAPNPHVDVQREGVIAPRHVLEPLLDPAVMVGLDDVLLAVIGPGMGSRCAESHVVVGGQGEQPPAAVPLGGNGLLERLPASRADLDLRGDQLLGDRLGEDRLFRDCSVAELLELLHQSEVGGVEQRELLLDPDREVGRVLEGRARGFEVEGAAPMVSRSDRSRGRRAGRRRGLMCGPSPRAERGSTRPSS